SDMTASYNLDWLISVDDHILEPPDIWQKRVAAKHRDAAPRIISDNGVEYWQFEDKRIPTIGLSAVAGRSKDQFSPDPITYADMRAGCYDSVARLDDMNRAGILASMCFPSFPRFCGPIFYEAKDPELGLACLKAYNDWIIEEWCGNAPGRYIPLIVIPLWDPAEAAREVERCAERGARALAFSENPIPLGLPSIHDKDRYWDPVWAAAEAAEVVVCMHQGSSSTRMRMAPDSPELVTIAWAIGSQSSGTLLDWLFSPVFVRYPGLKIALSEGGIGWMPYFLERAEQVVDKQRYWMAHDNKSYDIKTGEVKAGEKLEIDILNFDVREVFRKHVYGCFIEDESGLNNLDIIGADNVMIETDYPHSDSTWPNSIEVAHKQLANFDDETKYKILRGNAERLFRFTPAPAPDRAV
ncbi:MAG TPA: amidohydrolase family protein, partial [Acidimicrobiia bacterium]|nr:amidohydrolase family protein [Acidimicrobiia bacterium]